MWNNNLNLEEIDVPHGFELTENNKLFNEADVVVFHMPSLELEKEFTKRDKQLWVYWSMECEVHYPHLNTTEVLSMFDIKMTYHQESDVFTPYIESDFEEELRFKGTKLEERELATIFVSSAINKSQRFNYLAELMKHLEVHSYGRMFQNRKLNKDLGRISKLKTYSEYKFTLAFENAIARDYVTEKFYEPLIAGSLPIYLGAPNINEFAPGQNSFININDFKSPAELASYIHILDENEDQYMKYFEWKKEPYASKFMEKLEFQKQHPFIRLCHQINKQFDQIKAI